MNNKGQAALEYLMTYGWALVVIVIVVAALFAFGIFNPPSAGTCTGLSKLAYKDHALDSADDFTLIIANGNIGSIGTISASAGGDFDVASVCTPLPAAVPVGDDITVTCVDAFTGTGSYAGTVTVNYTVTGGTSHSETATCTGSA